VQIWHPVVIASQILLLCINSENLSTRHIYPVLQSFSLLEMMTHDTKYIELVEMIREEHGTL